MTLIKALKGRLDRYPPRDEAAGSIPVSSRMPVLYGAARWSRRLPATFSCGQHLPASIACIRIVRAEFTQCVR